jgi:hypothetical protein
MSEDNKWSKPTNPPPPLFLGEKERDLVKQINDELIERVIGQAITYLPISMERTDFHPLYGEAIEKSFLSPIRIYALVEFEGKTTITSDYGLDKDYSIVVKFHNRRLHEDQDMYVREGDYVQYGTSFFEIVSLTEDKDLFGQVEHRFQLIAKCIKTRKGLIDMKVLPNDVTASLTATPPAGAPTVTTSAPVLDIVRIIYSITPVSEISAGTSLNSLFGAPALSLLTSAVYEGGMRQNLTDNPATGEYYIVGGELYSMFNTPIGSRIILEVLTLI